MTVNHHKPVRRLPAGLSPAIPYLVLLIALVLTQGWSFAHVFGPLTAPDPWMYADQTWALASRQLNNPIRSEYQLGSDRKIRDIQLPRALADEANSHGVQKTTDTILLAIASPDSLPSAYSDGERDSQRTALSGGTWHDDLVTGNGRNNQYPAIPQFAPQAVGVALAMGRDKDVWTCLQWGRLANLTVFLALGLVALAAADRGRAALLFALANPVAVFLASSLSGDATVIALATLAVALTGRAWARPNWPWFGCLMPVAALLVLAKTAYTPLALIAVFAPEAGWRKRVALAASTLPTAIVFLWFQSTRANGMGAAGVDQALTGAWIKAHPLDDVRIIVENVVAWVGRGFGLDAVTLTVCAALAAWYLRRGAPDRRLTVVWLLAAFGALAVTFASLMLTWTRPDALDASSTLVGGWQARYTLPLIGLIGLLERPEETKPQKEAGRASRRASSNIGRTMPSWTSDSTTASPHLLPALPNIPATGMGSQWMPSRTGATPRRAGSTSGAPADM